MRVDQEVSQFCHVSWANPKHLQSVLLPALSTRRAARKNYNGYQYHWFLICVIFWIARINVTILQMKTKNLCVLWVLEEVVLICGSKWGKVGGTYSPKRISFSFKQFSRKIWPNNKLESPHLRLSRPSVKFLDLSLVLHFKLKIYMFI